MDQMMFILKSLKEQKNKLMNDINTSMLEKKSDSSEWYLILLMAMKAY